MTYSERARRYIAKMPDSVSGQGGHNALFAVACVLEHGFALPRNESEMLIREFNEEKCSPPWKEKELQHKLNSVHRANHRKPKGHLLQEASTKQIYTALPPKLRKRIESHSNKPSTKNPVTPKSIPSLSRKVLCMQEVGTEGGFIEASRKCDKLKSDTICIPNTIPIRTQKNPPLPPKSETG